MVVGFGDEGLFWGAGRRDEVSRPPHAARCAGVQAVGKRRVALRGILHGTATAGIRRIFAAMRRRISRGQSPKKSTNGGRFLFLLR